MKAFAVLDSKTGVFSQPIFAPTTEDATRIFDELTSQESTQFYKFPEDYILFELGEYDDQSGRFKNLDAPQSLCSAMQVKVSRAARQQAYEHAVSQAQAQVAAARADLEVAK